MKILVLFALMVLSIVVIVNLTDDAYAISQNDCTALTHLSATELGFTVVTCDFPFNVIVNMGQRLSWSETLPWQGKYYHTITSKTGLFDMTDMGSTNMLPSAWGGIGVYEYYDKLNPTLTGKITVQNPPDVGIAFQNVQVSFSGSQMSVSGNIVNSNNFPVKDLYVYWHVADSSGNYLTSWTRYGGSDGQAYSAQIPAQSTGTFSETVCCVPSSGASTATPYIVQAFRDDGTKLISINNSPPDTDGDGISDSIDQCPTQAEIVNGFQDTDGCPDVVSTYSNTAIVEMAKGSGSNTNCADKCYTPSNIQINIGGTVTWKNVDTAAHTVTSGKDATSDGIFDSGMIMVGNSFDYKFNREGTYPYYDMVHPWMKGIILVGGEKYASLTDTDGDGILDSSDSCPSQKETANGYQDADGCPDVVPPTDENTTAKEMLAKKIMAAKEAAIKKAMADKEAADKKARMNEKMSEKETAQKEIDDAKKAAQKEIDDAKKAAQKEIDDAKKAAQKEIDDAKKAAQKAITDAKKTSEKTALSDKKITDDKKKDDAKKAAEKKLAEKKAEKIKLAKEKAKSKK